MTSKQIRVHEFDSLLEAEMATAALSEAGIRATIQGKVAGQLLANLMPARFPLLVACEQAEAARDVLRNLGISERREESSREPHAAVKRRLGPVRGTIVRLYVFTLLAVAGLAVTAIVVTAIADAAQATPHGHMINAPIPFRYIVAAIALLLTFSRWARSKGAIFIVALTIAFVAVSVAPRMNPASPRGPVPHSTPLW
jgi:hypothetical protein